MSMASGNNRNSGPWCLYSPYQWQHLIIKKEMSVPFLKIIAGSVVVVNLTLADRDYFKLFYRNGQSDKA